jgi:diacylglycerol kinase family enzyme
MLFFVNPLSGAGDRTGPADLIRQAMAGNHVSYGIIEINKDLNLQEVKEMILESKAHTVVAAGGDGTVNFIATSILEMPVKLGILPTGSANGLAYELGIPLRPEDALQMLMSGQSQPLDAVRINDDRISLHLSDFGINARIIKGFEEEGKRGFFRYFKPLLRVLSKPHSFRCMIITPVKTYIHRSFMTVIANSGKYRSGAVINPTGKKDDGRFEVIVMKAGRTRLVRNILAAFTGKFHDEPNIEVYECTSVRIRVRPPQELQIDGELLGKQEEVKADILKHALQVIVPS